MNTNTYRKIVTVNYEDNGYLRFKNISDQIGFLYPYAYGDLHLPPTIEYSLDGVNWETMNLNSVYQNYVQPYGDIAGTIQMTGIKVFPGRNIYLRGVNTSGLMRWEHSGWGLRMDVPHTIAGNILSIIDYNNMNSITSLPDYCFGFIRGNQRSLGLFGHDTALVSVKNLSFGNVSILGKHSLHGLFSGCSNMVDVPDMSGFVTVGEGSMNDLFYQCTSLNDNVDLSGVTSVGNYGMTSMFQNCTSFNGNVDLSSVTTVGSYGLREAFKGCTSLNGNVDLSSVTTLADYGMYQTFYNCYNLNGVINMSQLSQISGQSLNETFRNCRALTQAPSLANLTTFNGGNCMTNTYRDCYLLQEITAPNMNPWDTSQSMSWMENAGRDVPAGTQKTAYVPSGVTIEASVDGIPGDWTQVPY